LLWLSFLTFKPAILQVLVYSMLWEASVNSYESIIKLRLKKKPKIPQNPQNTQKTKKNIWLGFSKKTCVFCKPAYWCCMQASAAWSAVIPPFRLTTSGYGSHWAGFIPWWQCCNVGWRIIKRRSASRSVSCFSVY